MFKNTLDIKIKGKNIERFIKRLNSYNIDILNIKYIKYNEIIIRINKEDYKFLERLKTIYEIEIININGIDKIRINIKNNKYLILSFIISIFILIILSNTIFKVEVIHNNESLRKIILNELDNYNIKKYHFKKNYKTLQKVKKHILNKYKDQIEWLEIESNGTKYTVRVEERIIDKKETNYEKRNIVAKKDATILKIEAKTGEILKEKNMYVKKGDVIISGELKLNDEIKKNIMADGKVYGEVWYKATVEYPYNYKEKKLTGKMKKVFVIKIFNHYIEFLNLKKYKTKIRKDKILLKHSFLPISLIIEKQYETKETKTKLTKKEAVKRAKLKIKNYINDNLGVNEHIIATKKLKLEENNSKIILVMFISVCEDITAYEQIIEE